MKLCSDSLRTPDYMWEVQTKRKKKGKVWLVTNIIQVKRETFVQTSSDWCLPMTNWWKCVKNCQCNWTNLSTWKYTISVKLDHDCDCDKENQKKIYLCSERRCSIHRVVQIRRKTASNIDIFVSFSRSVWVTSVIRIDFSSNFGTKIFCASLVTHRLRQWSTTLTKARRRR